MKPLVIYHGDCVDGFTSAWVAGRFYGFGDVDLHAGVYGEAPPDVTGRHVVVVDFSYPATVLTAMAWWAASVVVLDHHKTAQEGLAGFPLPPKSAAEWGLEVAGRGPRGVPRVLFDMNRSGAGLAWDWFFPEVERPALVDMVEDYDLWRFLIPDSRRVHEWVASHEQNLWGWDGVSETLSDPGSRGLVLSEAEAISRSRDRLAEDLIRLGSRRMWIGGFEVLAVNAPRQLASTIGHILADGQPFGATYVDMKGYREFSLRSHEGGADVGEIAKSYGGGGHKHAAGFRRPLD